MKGTLITVGSLVVVYLLWQFVTISRITIVVPEHFNGPVAIIERADGAKPEGFAMIKKYTIPEDGILRLKRIEPFFDWYNLKLERPDEREIKEVRGNDKAKGYRELGTHWAMNMTESTTQDEKDKNAVIMMWIGSLDEIDEEAYQDFIKTARNTK